MIKSFLSDKVETRDNSKIHKTGIFAKEKISKGEIVCIKGGHILRRNEIYSSSVINCYHPISDEYFLGALSAEEEENVKIYINHSCDPNCGLRGEITFVAMRDINANEELTFDYAMLDNEDYEFKCLCGSPNCRKIIRGHDWKIKELQDKYKQYFAEYLKEKM